LSCTSVIAEFLSLRKLAGERGRADGAIVVLAARARICELASTGGQSQLG
jgi:hypothetical protein